MQSLPTFGDASDSQSLWNAVGDGLDNSELVPFFVIGLEVVQLVSILLLAPFPAVLDAVEFRPIRDVEDEGDLVLFAVPVNVIGVMDAGVVCEDDESVS
jgi:hypothetical protein